ncbi:MAG: SGNH/GDSL hydrolase family protein [Candidatus Eremiobacteraeota bacterium]|nr:SGNH/GDSL hydrolase family protein [Candidatus Eremiobacteraeota bacterium]
MTASMARRNFVGALVASAGLYGCGGGNGVTLPPQPVAKAVAYTAIGASDAAGYGASVTCNTAQNPVAVALPACPGGTGYVPDLARLLGNGGAVVTLNDLGISGAVIGPDILALRNQYTSFDPASPGTSCLPRPPTDNPGDFITNELPNVKGNETLVTIFAGGNDTNAIVNAALCMTAGGATQTVIANFIATEIAAFGADFDRLRTGIAAKAPGAKIVVANLPNFAGIPFAQAPAVAPAKPLLQAVSVGIDTNVYAAEAAAGVPTVDLLCDARSYDPANYFTDGFHPNDAGYANLAGLYYSQIKATTPVRPQTNCQYATAFSAARRPLPRGIPAFDPVR